MKNNISNIGGSAFNAIPLWLRISVLAVVLIVLIIIVWVLLKKTGVVKTDEEKVAQDVEVKVEKDTQQLLQQGQKPTFLRTSYAGFADKLFSAGAGQNKPRGTDEQKIYAVFVQMKNDLDIALLTAAFGQRDVSFTWSEKAGLHGWITNELDNEELRVLNMQLAKQGIKYRF